MKLIKLTWILFFFLAFTSCKKEEPKSPQEIIEGKWIIQSQEILGEVTAGDGSYLTFDACGNTSCTGTDYKASDNTYGSITYVLNSDATILTINDPTSDGGSYDADWDILELTETDLRITTSTILGNLKIEMTKQ